jgi:hypothetical protein
MYHPRTPHSAENVSFHDTYVRCVADSNGGDCEKSDGTARDLRDVFRHIHPGAGASGPAEARARGQEVRL